MAPRQRLRASHVWRTKLLYVSNVVWTFDISWGLFGALLRSYISMLLALSLAQAALSMWMFHFMSPESVFYAKVWWCNIITGRFFWASCLQTLTAWINLSNTPFERETPRHQYSKATANNSSTGNPLMSGGGGGGSEEGDPPQKGDRPPPSRGYFSLCITILMYEKEPWHNCKKRQRCLWTWRFMCPL